jgi:hypothetical protein
MTVLHAQALLPRFKISDVGLILVWPEKSDMIKISPEMTDIVADMMQTIF